MRHATPVMTLGTYAQAVTSDKRNAKYKITSLILPAVEKRNASSLAFLSGPTKRPIVPQFHSVSCRKIW